MNNFEELKKYNLNFLNNELKNNKVDKQLISLINLLNKIDGLYTTESCCGHNKERCCIWFRVKNFNVLKSFVYNCLNCFKAWEIIMDHFDMDEDLKKEGESFHIECIYQNELLQESIDNLEISINEYLNIKEMYDEK